MKKQKMIGLVLYLMFLFSFSIFVAAHEPIGIANDRSSCSEVITISNSKTPSYLNSGFTLTTTDFSTVLAVHMDNKHIDFPHVSLTTPLNNMQFTLWFEVLSIIGVVITLVILLLIIRKIKRNRQA